VLLFPIRTPRFLIGLGRIGAIEQTRGSPLGYLPAISTVRLPSSIAIAIRRR
jgi:hypothetical protein